METFPVLTRPQLLKSAPFVGGEWLPRTDKCKVFPVYNPANGHIITEVNC